MNDPLKLIMKTCMQLVASGKIPPHDMCRALCLIVAIIAHNAKLREDQIIEQFRAAHELVQALVGVQREM